MNAKHTGGPWIVGNDGLPHGAQFEILAGEDWYVTGVPWRDDVYDTHIPRYEQAEANARLIAEAPAMLEALRAIAEILEHDCGCPPCEGSMAPAEHHLALAIAILARIDGGKS